MPVININKRDKYYNKGIENLNNKRFNLAQSNFKKALKFNPRDVFVLNELGVANSLMGKINVALKNFRKAYEIDPSYETVKLNFNRAERAIKNSDDFIAVFKQDLKKIKFLKCIRCGSRDFLVPHPVTHIHRERYNINGVRVIKETVGKSILIPYCVKCRKFIRTPDPYVSFETGLFKEPLIKKNGRLITYHDWIAQIFYWDDLPNMDFLYQKSGLQDQSNLLEKQFAQEKSFETVLYNYLKSQGSAYTIRALEKRLDKIVDDPKEIDFGRENIEQILKKMRSSGKIHSVLHDGEDNFFVPP